MVVYAWGMTTETTPTTTVELVYSDTAQHLADQHAYLGRITETRPGVWLVERTDWSDVTVDHGPNAPHLHVTSVTGPHAKDRAARRLVSRFNTWANANL
jgi:hypothetical protein